MIMRTFSWNLYDNADGPMLLDVINYNAIENGIGEVLTLARSPMTLESDQSSCYNIAKNGLEEVMILNFDPTILDLDMNYVLVGHEKHALCDSYIGEFVHDDTENYYVRGKYGCRNFHVTKTPLFLLKF